MYIYPHKRNVAALLKLGVIIKVVVVAILALATDCFCCCCWSIHRVRRHLISDSIVKYRDLLENAVSCSSGINR